MMTDPDRSYQRKKEPLLPRRRRRSDNFNMKETLSIAILEKKETRNNLTNQQFTFI